MKKYSVYLNKDLEVDDSERCMEFMKQHGGKQRSYIRLIASGGFRVDVEGEDEFWAWVVNQPWYWKHRVLEET